MPDRQETYGRLMDVAFDNLLLGKYAKGYIPGYCGFELRRVDQEHGAAVIRLMLFDYETKKPLVHFGDFTVYIDTTLGVEDWHYETPVILRNLEDEGGEDDEE